MNSGKMTIKEIEALFASGNVPEEFLAECRKDSRKSVGTILRRYDRMQREMDRLAALYAFERQAYQDGYELVAGVDEAGRGPLAGPVAAAAVILPKCLKLPHLNDSKKLSPARRDELYDKIQAHAVAVGVSMVDAATIDRVNIYQASVNAMYNAIFALQPEPQKVLTDAIQLKRLPMPWTSIVHGDAKSASIAAASIIAKVTRDRQMDLYDQEYPQYGFARHKGYGTAEHVEALRRYGPCPIHRRSFEPVKSITQPSGT